MIICLNVTLSAASRFKRPLLSSLVSNILWLQPANLGKQDAVHVLLVILISLSVFTVVMARNYLK